MTDKSVGRKNDDIINLFIKNEKIIYGTWSCSNGIRCMYPEQGCRKACN